MKSSFTYNVLDCQNIISNRVIVNFYNVHMYFDCTSDVCNAFINSNLVTETHMFK